MTGNRAVVYSGPRAVKDDELSDPNLVDPRGKKCHHAVIIKHVTTSICGGDVPIYRRRLVVPEGVVPGPIPTARNVGTTHNLSRRGSPLSSNCIRDRREPETRAS